MNVSLAPELEKFIEGKVQSGLYSSASEVVREALRLLVEKDAEVSARLSSLRESLQEGLESGPAKRFDVEEVKRKARSKKAGGHA